MVAWERPAFLTHTNTFIADKLKAKKELFTSLRDAFFRDGLIKFTSCSIRPHLDALAGHTLKNELARYRAAYGELPRDGRRAFR